MPWSKLPLFPYNRGWETQPNNRVLYTNYKDSVIKGGRFPIPNKTRLLTMAHIFDQRWPNTSSNPRKMWAAPPSWPRCYCLQQKVSWRRRWGDGIAIGSCNFTKWRCGCQPKNRGKTPKMDGENNGKPYWNGWFGGTTILETPMWVAWNLFLLRKKNHPKDISWWGVALGGGDTLRFPFYNRDYIINHFKDPY